ncbi:hypothetical protein GCM10007918_38170 [Piscinibacter gummiphilus]|nr:hypothetical protein GCM10007918_38170 [Piscinibacter gummiphilus]
MDVGISAAVTPKLSDILPERAGKPVDAHDYAMAALIFVETSNRAVMVSKQQMKLAVMHIGFAVISIGLMLIALGIDAGGIDVTGQSPDSKYSVSLKVASTGVLVFVIGAGMATIGGIMKTEYQTLSTPSFSDGESVPAANVDSKKARRLAAMPPAIEWCRKNVPTPASKLDECLADAVRELSQ